MFTEKRGRVACPRPRYATITTNKVGKSVSTPRHLGTAANAAARLMTRWRGVLSMVLLPYFSTAQNDNKMDTMELRKKDGTTEHETERDKEFYIHATVAVRGFAESGCT